MPGALRVICARRFEPGPALSRAGMLMLALLLLPLLLAGRVVASDIVQMHQVTDLRQEAELMRQQGLVLVKLGLRLLSSAGNPVPVADAA